MSSIKPHRDGYRAQIYVNGIRESACFRTLREANAWSAQRETALREMVSKPPSQRHTLKQAIEKYLKEETPKKRGSREEEIRLTRLMRSNDLPVDVLIGEVTATHIAAFRDSRLRQVKPASVLRELGSLSSLFETAKIEWKWIQSNPVREIRKPPRTKHRERLISLSEVRKMLKVMGYSRKGPKTVSSAVSYAFLLSLRTGMRAGEVSSLRWDQVSGNALLGVGTKTDSRNIPLSRQARMTIERLRGWDSTYVVAVPSRTIDALFRRYRERAGLSGFTYHDSRHTAATWIAQKLHVLDLCKMMGWSSTTRALCYYNPTADDIARRL